MEPTVRRATRADAADVVGIARESWHAAYDEILGPETVDERIDEWYAADRLAETIEDAADRDDAAFLVGECASEDAFANASGDSPLVGFAHAGPDPEGGDAATLFRMYVSPAAWGEGLGSVLLGRVETTLADHFDRLRLEVLAGNDVGVSFYESTGFERIRTRESVVGDGVTECVYEKSL